MGSRLLWRRSATALAIYGSTALGVLGSVVAARVLGPVDFGRFALVVATTALFQLLLDLTSEEALVKFGFRYAERGDWGRFRRLFRLAVAFKGGSALVAGLVIAALAPAANWLFGTNGLTGPLLVAALLPLLQSLEGIAASALVLRTRYDIRAGFLLYAMALRLAAIAVTASHGVLSTIVGLLAAQVLSTVSIGAAGLVALARYPRAPAEPLGPDRAEIVRFVVQSSLGTGLVSLRGWIAPILLGLVTGVREVGYFRAAQAPLQGFAALSSPVRLILLTEQTRDWERGRADLVHAGVRRYVFGSSLLMAAALVPFWLLMPALIRLVLPGYEAATDAARIVLVAAAVQLVFGWTKSFAVSIGRPKLRVLAHGVELVVLVPLTVVLGAAWGATGAAVALLAATLAFATVWTGLVLRLRNEPLPRAPVAPAAPTEVTAV